MHDDTGKDPPEPSLSPQEASAVGTAAKAPCHILPHVLVLILVLAFHNSINVVEGELRTRLDIHDRKECHVMKMLVCMVTDSRKDAQVRVAGMVDEPSRTRHELAVYEERWASETMIEGIGV
jgi:hypothetical protein